MQGLKAQEAQLAQLREAISEGQAMLQADAAKKRREEAKAEWKAKVVVAQAAGKLHTWGWPVLGGAAK